MLGDYGCACAHGRSDLQTDHNNSDRHPNTNQADDSDRERGHIGSRLPIGPVARRCQQSLISAALHSALVGYMFQAVLVGCSEPICHHPAIQLGQTRLTLHTA
eukprot:COSAG06_NODE_18711_length_872_cov_1.166882_2_plen_103_part_00